MPHFIIDCSDNIIHIKSPEEIMESVYKTAESTGLFAEGDIKVRINPFSNYRLGKGKNGFIHVFANIMEGRTAEQKQGLSQKIVSVLNAMFPDIAIISMNIRDFEKASYCNKSMIM
ncbi:MAG: 5-carboxymethyl-2-hydroxymuconate Delta-isomerase [Fulvivirga sp.]|uniref:5-carboxymethyl-2-hydroxymuconate Delta-isomerase n=1 Tax=Fulvivirga sp. TaxID=1931237 RepID=UPI0032EC12FE